MRALFPLSRPWPGGPVVLWGGEFPSGSLKYLTFSRYLESVPAGAKGLVELSGASSALALDTLGRERGIPVVAVTDVAGTANLRARGFGGEVRTVQGSPPRGSWRWATSARGGAGRGSSPTRRSSAAWSSGPHGCATWCSTCTRP
ncbi:hypothetical protein ACLESO_25900 [Pyxidicoccus sp. 3LG]